MASIFYWPSAGAYESQADNQISTPNEVKLSVLSQAYAFDDLDKNHDGRLRRSEIPHEMKQLRTYFDRFDVDHNLALSPNEYGGYLSSNDDFPGSKVRFSNFPKGERHTAAPVMTNRNTSAGH
jgi:hypothetical protein